MSKTEFATDPDPWGYRAEIIDGELVAPAHWLDVYVGRAAGPGITREGWAVYRHNLRYTKYNDVCDLIDWLECQGIAAHYLQKNRHGKLSRGEWKYDAIVVPPDARIDHAALKASCDQASKERRAMERAMFRGKKKRRDKALLKWLGRLDGVRAPDGLDGEDGAVRIVAWLAAVCGIDAPRLSMVERLNHKATVVHEDRLIRLSRPILEERNFLGRLALITHEFTHLVARPFILNKETCHCRAFQRIEQALLALWDVRVYGSRIARISDSQVLWFDEKYFNIFENSNPATQ